ERCDHARFANARLAGDQHHLALPLPRQLLAREREFDLRLATDETDRACRADCLEATLRCRCTFDRPHRDGLGDALDLAATEIAKIEEIAEQPARRRGNDNSTQLRQALQPGREVWRITDSCLLLRRSSADEIADHHKPGCDCDPDL